MLLLLFCGNGFGGVDILNYPPLNYLIRNFDAGCFLCDGAAAGAQHPYKSEQAANLGY